MKLEYITKQISLLPLHIIGTFCYMISFCSPKKKNLWIYGAWFGQKFSDNSMHFFKYMLKNQPEINSVWITKNEIIYKKLKEQGIPVEKSNSLKGILIQLRAEFVILTSGKYDVNQNFITSKTKTIQLWHGIPLKKIVFDTYLNKIYNRLVKYLFFLPVLKNLLNFDMIISTSEFLKERFSGAFNLPERQTPITGYPRNDIFFKPESKPNKEKIILYAPTHRNEGMGDKLPEYLSMGELGKVNEAIKILNVKLYIKLHYCEEEMLGDIDFSNIVILKSDPLFDIQEFLCKTDILITDYSSIYFDFLLLDRPIIFFAYDLEDYKQNDRGLYESYEDVTPGDIVETWDQVLSGIARDLKNPDKFSKERKLFCDKCWDYKDGNSSQRVYEAITKQFNL